tara:strand:+ start:216 stop:1004 length:789 start_codon:yes stop_codon:yes gene_type:complete
MLGMGLGHYQRLEQRHYLSHAQKLGLKQLLKLELKLKHPEYPNAVKGLEGMQIAHQILQEREASGVLIGGLSEAVWNQRRKEEDLYKHKDVDVLVLDDAEVDKFEGGVDWWLPERGKITLKSDYGSVEGVDKQWYVNGNGVVLSFGAQKHDQLPPGLYIPDSEWVIDMREAEAEAHIDYGRVDVEFDGDVFEKFRAHIEKRVKTRLPKFIREAFQGYVLSPHYESDDSKVYAVGLERFDLETLRGIHGLEGIVEETPANSGE